ncbi:MAG: MSHA pilin protein MshA [Oleispira sp.]|jgi:MSHA pilin protein MshA
MRKINKQAGFTLIELIMVIVILGVLSAFALPRFADLGGDARAASLNGAGGSMKAASNIAHAAQLAGGIAVGGSVTLEGTVITMANGYPTDAGIMLAAQISAPDYTVTGDTVTIPGASDDTSCSVVYTEATSTVPASVAITDSSC